MSANRSLTSHSTVHRARITWNRHQIPPGVREFLTDCIERGVSAYVLQQWYRSIHIQMRDDQSRILERPADSAPDGGRDVEHCTGDRPVTYGCPWCFRDLKNRKDFIRHLDETCNRLYEYQCPDCKCKYQRASHFRNHRAKNHPACCTMSPCTHDKDAKRDVPDRRIAFGCGFCAELFGSKSEFYQHLVRHYHSGASLVHWNVDLQLHNLLRQPSIAGVKARISQEYLVWEWWLKMQHERELKEDLIAALERDTPETELYQKLLNFVHQGIQAGHGISPSQEARSSEVASESMQDPTRPGSALSNVTSLFGAIAAETTKSWHDGRPPEMAGMNNAEYPFLSLPGGVHSLYGEDSNYGTWINPNGDAVPPFSLEHSNATTLQYTNDPVLTHTYPGGPQLGPSPAVLACGQLLIEPDLHNSPTAERAGASGSSTFAAARRRR